MDLASMQRAEMLRNHEELCFRIAHYLLGEESKATYATRDTLMELGHDPLFFDKTANEQTIHAKRVVMKHSLAWRCKLTKQTV